MKKKYLLDTCAFIWCVHLHPSLSLRVKKILSQDHLFLLSSASIWEMALKINAKKLKLQEPLKDFIHHKIAIDNFDILPVYWNHSCAVSNLPLHHRDPFDRLLIAQCMEEDIPILSPDPEFKKYDITVLW